MLKFSANLGFLWTDIALPDAIFAAHGAGFDAVECHFPYSTRPADVCDALRETGLRMVGLNTSPGNVEFGDFGLCALPDRVSDAQAVIEQAIDYASKVGAQNVHVMAGKIGGAEARETFIKNLNFACERANDLDITILIEPLNIFDAPGYFLNSNSTAAEIISEIGASKLKLMFDCYHAHRNGDDVIKSIKNLYPIIGHVQIAASPDRGAPDHGALDYDEVFRSLETMGHSAPIGAEYKPVGSTDDSLEWLRNWRKTG